MGEVEEWQCLLSLDGMAPGQAPLPSTFRLRFSPDGGLVGFKERPMADLDRLVSRTHGMSDNMTATRMFRMAGDVWGEYHQEGVRFTLLTREKVGRYQFRGKWSSFMQSVKEGNCRFGADLTQGAVVTTLGTFQMSKGVTDSTQARESCSGSAFCKNLARYMATAAEDKKFYDLIIKTRDGAQLPAHKVVLASQTSYFEGLFRQENPEQVSLNFECTIVQKCLDYLYTGTIVIQGYDVQDILTCANYLVIQDVVEKCEDFIVRNLDTANCLEVLLFADQISSMKVMKAALEFSSKHFQALATLPSLRSLPVHLHREILKSDSLALYSQFGTLLTDEHREDALERHLQRFEESGVREEGLVRRGEDRVGRELGKGVDYHPSNLAVFGRPGDHPTAVENFKVDTLDRLSPEFPFGNSIRGVMVKVVEWDGRQVVGGIVLHWANGQQDRCGVEENEVEGLRLMEVPEGSHIAFVLGRSGWYVDNLTFVLSTGQVLGGEEQNGGDGGGLKHTLARLQPKFNVTNMHLQGVKGKVVRSQGVNLITNVTFIYKVAADEQMESKDMESLEESNWLPGSLVDSDDDGESNYSVDSEHWLDDAEDFFDNEYMEEEEVDFED